MPCYVKKQPGGNLFVCGDLGEHCADCGCLGEFLCDYPVGDGKTCDRSLCLDHAHEIAPDTHYCAPHYAAWQAFRESGGVKRELENVVPYKAIRPAGAPVKLED